MSVGVLAMAMGSGGPASADTEGWHVGAEGGLNILPQLTPQSGWAEKFNTGGAAILQGGYEVDHVTFEGEVSWRGNDISQVSRPVTVIGSNYRFPSVTTLTSSAQGAITVGAAMANVYYNLETGTELTPYLGVGVGDARISQNRIGVGGGDVGNLDGVSYAFAYQGTIFRQG
jgi:opacity protein-like surface antigen